jgi:putative flippase GtrA
VVSHSSRLSRLITVLLRGQTFREWFVEFVQFCVVGLGSYIVDVGLFNLLAHGGFVTLPGDPSMTAKVISVTISVIFSWIMNRLWTFRKSRNDDKTREFVIFVLVNLGGMLIALACLWFSRYVLGLRSQLADNISANVVGLVLGTAFRYVMYRYVVFRRAPTSTAEDAAAEALDILETHELGQIQLDVHASTAAPARTHSDDRPSRKDPIRIE